jgi:hypothetical protein
VVSNVSEERLSFIFSIEPDVYFRGTNFKPRSGHRVILDYFSSVFPDKYVLSYTTISPFDDVLIGFGAV